MAERIDVAELNVQFAGDLRQLSNATKEAQKLINQGFDKIIEAADGVAESFDDIEEKGDDVKDSATELNSKIQLIERGYDQLKQTIAGAVDLGDGAEPDHGAKGWLADPLGDDVFLFLLLLFLRGGARTE